MYNQLPLLDLLPNLNTNPIPLEFGQSLTTGEMLASLQAKVNEIIIIRNEVVQDANNYTIEKFNQLQGLINELTIMLNNGNIIPNGSIGLEKLNNDFLGQMGDVVTNMVHDLAKTVWFGINDNGYFYAVIPSDWEQLQFNTTQEGNLILQY
jgi:hypothetical protein